MEQYPQGYVLLEKKNSQSKHARRAFEKKLLQVLDLFFKALRDQVLAVCKDEGLRVTSVGITIPGQWPAVVEDFFTRTVMKTLLKKETHIQVPRGNIYFHTETQALGHYIFEHRADLLRQYGTNKGTFLLADFGGQNLVSGDASRNYTRIIFTGCPCLTSPRARTSLPSTSSLHLTTP